MTEVSTPAPDLPRFARIREKLDFLANRPPQALLLEGGDGQSRLEFGLYWAMAANCPQALAGNGAGARRSPCRACPVCRQISSLEYLDLFVFDGTIANKADEEKPGPIRALRMENLRDLKTRLGSQPHGNGKRVVIIQGMSKTREEALNSLLKTLEEPTEHTLFTLLAPQRQQIPQTLVSRSLCLTLPWPEDGAQCADPGDLAGSLAIFLENGTGFLDKLGGKGAITQVQALALIQACQAALARIMAQNPKKASPTPLDKAMAPLAASPAAAFQTGQWLAEANKMLSGTVTPARVLEAISTRLHLLLRADKRPVA